MANIITTHRVKVIIEAPQDETEKSYSRKQAFSFEMESALPLHELQYITQQMFASLVMSGRPQTPQHRSVREVESN